MGNGSIIIFHRSKVMKTQVLHFVMWYSWWGCWGNLKLITLDYSSKIWGQLVQLSSNLNEYQVLSLHCVSSSTIAENKMHCQAGWLSFYLKLFVFTGPSVPWDLLWTLKNSIQEGCQLVQRSCGLEKREIHVYPSLRNLIVTVFKTK